MICWSCVLRYLASLDIAREESSLSCLTYSTRIFHHICKQLDSYSTRLIYIVMANKRTRDAPATLRLNSELDPVQHRGVSDFSCVFFLLEK
mmetsp:Transcript_51685/g.103768  ORF Transcript_51685/g.103768 Transcript_51685/m.103768 type:complete len:91 (+) Transcript_51685:14-286(+)